MSHLQVADPHNICTVILDSLGQCMCAHRSIAKLRLPHLKRSFQEYIKHLLKKRSDNYTPDLHHDSTKPSPRDHGPLRIPAPNHQHHQPPHTPTATPAIQNTKVGSAYTSSPERTTLVPQLDARSIYPVSTLTTSTYSRKLRAAIRGLYC